jgi:hypothetical protein
MVYNKKEKTVSIVSWQNEAICKPRVHFLRASRSISQLGAWRRINGILKFFLARLDA